MRLIDIDKISKDAEWDENYDGFISYSSAMIDEAEIIEAIPIWWIEMFAQRYKIEGSSEFKVLHLMITKWEKWEKENEVN